MNGMKQEGNFIQGYPLYVCRFPLIQFDVHTKKDKLAAKRFVKGHPLRGYNWIQFQNSNYLFLLHPCIIFEHSLYDVSIGTIIFVVCWYDKGKKYPTHCIKVLFSVFRIFLLNWCCNFLTLNLDFQAQKIWKRTLLILRLPRAWKWCYQPQHKGTS